MNDGLGALLTERLALSPDRPAFRFSGQVLTYAELDLRAGAVGRTLADMAVEPGDRVGIVMTKGLEMPVAIHGIWKAGAAFVPLDTSSPAGRIAQIIEECGIRVLVSSERNAELAAQLAVQTGATVVDAGNLKQSQSGDFSPVTNRKDDIAYVIFTSGSTGRPKGIVHTHGSGRAFAEMWSRLYDVKQDDVCFCTVPLHFDFSLADFMAVPISGACTELVPEAALSFPASLAALMEQSGATIWSTVPHALIQLCERGAIEARDLSHLRLVIFGGEPLAPGKLKMIRKSLGTFELSNSYGPAEVNQVTVYQVPEDHPADRAIPIGGPTDHAELAVDDKDMLLVRTPAMMRGYWGRPDLDGAAFAVREGKTFYRTGDLAKQGDEGLWRFIGREDRQVKLRGYRVELDEVERVLAGHQGVSEAAVVVSPDGLSLIAHITRALESEVQQDTLAEYASSLLPPYAVPSDYVIRESFTRTTTGKIDRRALAQETS